MMRGLVLCADDYGLSPGIDRAIVELSAQRRLSAVSCMTGAAHWPADAALLKPFIGKIDIGLHLTLVDERPITPMPRTAPRGRLPDIKRMLITSHLRALDHAEIKAEINAQFDAFEAAMGCAPDHVDGHLHTHVFPVIRDIVRDVTAARAPQAWLRNIAEPYSEILSRGITVPKALFLSALGWVFSRRISSNDGFAGVYGLRGDENIEALFRGFLKTRARKPVVMCHPGDCADEQGTTRHARTNEYVFLKSQAFADLLAQSGFELRRFKDL
ncbi:MAG: ChbG/HpnK family deacetylase [Rhodospirillaceae bacterium]|nr:ChbG/HpnK family deacetylase [Rhodospirillaceae bacterium]